MEKKIYGLILGHVSDRQEFSLGIEVLAANIFLLLKSGGPDAGGSQF